jgi:hypothetical protein
MAYNDQTWDDKLGISDALRQQMLEEEERNAVNELGLDVGRFQVEQVAALAEQDLDFLAGLAIPEVYKFGFPPVLKAAWQLVTTAATSVSKMIQIALGIPRGHGKTTFIKLFILWCILFTDQKFILIISSTADLSENILADVEDMLSEMNIKQVFGDWSIGVETRRQNLKKFSYRGRPVIIACMGAGGSLRGLNLKNERPSVIVFDDIQTKECSESKIQSDALERWMIGTAMKAKSPFGCLFIFAGNMYPGTNSILKKLKSNPTWVKFISGAILSDKTALWPELRSFESLIAELDNDIFMGHPEIFFSEVMNDTEVGINTNTDLSALKPWKWMSVEQPQAKFIVIDPSTGKRGGDAVTIGYFEVYDEIVGFRQLIEENLSPGNTIRQAILLALQTKTRLIAVESVGYQSTLLYWFKVISEQLKLTGFSFVEIHSGSNSKNTRITQALKALTAGEIILHEDTKNFVINQVLNWNPLKRDNEDGILDVLTYGPMVMRKYGPLALSYEQELILGDSSPGVEEFNSSF